MNPDLVDVPVLLRILRARWRLIALTALIAPPIAFATLIAIPPVYKSSSELFIQDAASANPVLEDMSIKWTLKDRLPVLTSILRSRSMLEHVLRNLGDIDDTSSEALADARIRDFRKRVTIFTLGGGVVRIELTEKSPERVHRALKDLTDMLVTEMLRPQKQAVSSSAEFLRSQLDRIRGDLATLESDKTAIKSANNAALPEVYKAVLENHVATERQLFETQLSVEVAKRKRDLMLDRARQYNPRARGLESRLHAAQADLAELGAKLAADHPEMRSQKRRVAILRREMSDAEATAVDLKALTMRFGEDAPIPSAQLAFNVNDSPELPTSELLTLKAAVDEVETLQVRKKALANKVTESADTLRGIAGREETLNRIGRDADIKAGVYHELSKKYEEAIVTRELSLRDEAAQVWQIEPPGVPSEPTRGKASTYLLLSLILGAALGAILSIVIEAGARRVWSPEAAALYLGVKHIGTLPRIGGRP